MTAEVAAVAAAHPDIVQRFSIGKSYQGREHLGGQDLGQRRRRRGRARGHVRRHPPRRRAHGHRDDPPHPPLAGRRLRDRPADHEHREHAARSGSSSLVNPDGAEYDISGGKFHYWRKNRQPTPGTTVDRHRPQPQLQLPLGRRRPDELEPGGHHLPRDRRPSRRPRTRAMRDFLASRVVDGRQQIRAAITFHEDGRLVMWPYGYTMTNVPADMTTQDHAALAIIGKHMAATNGYKPEQASDLYISSGTSRDYQYGDVPDLRLHVRDVGQGLPRRLADRLRDRPQQGSRAVPDGDARGARCPSWAPRSGRPAAAPSTTTSRSPAAGPSTPTAPTRRRPARGSPGRTRRRPPATARSSSGRRASGAKAFVTGAAAGVGVERERPRWPDDDPIARPSTSRRRPASG